MAVTYLVSLGISVFLFGFCSYGAYDYIYEYDDASRSFVQELARRLSIRILAKGKDPMKEKISFGSQARWEQVQFGWNGFA